MNIKRLLSIIFLLFFISNSYAQTLEACFRKNDTAELRKLITRNTAPEFLRPDDSVSLFLTDIVDWFVSEYELDRNNVFRTRGVGRKPPVGKLITVGSDSILTGYMNGDDFEINKILKRTGRMMPDLPRVTTFTNKKRYIYKINSKSGVVKISDHFKRMLNTFLGSHHKNPVPDGQQRADFLRNYFVGLSHSNMSVIINGVAYSHWYFYPDISFEAIYFDYQHRMALVIYNYAYFKDEVYLKRNENGEWLFDEKGTGIIYN